MKRKTGEEKIPIWLIGDSEPDNWENYLDTPFDPRKTNVIPLLHRSIAGRGFISSHKVFCGGNDEKANYFEYCAKHIATISGKYEGFKKNICWIERLLPHCNFLAKSHKPIS